MSELDDAVARLASLPPPKSMPRCMMPDGGDCCPEYHQALQDIEKADNRAMYWQLLSEKADVEIERLRAALKPFADAAAQTKGYAASARLGMDPAASLHGLSVADLQNAADAVNQQHPAMGHGHEP